MERNIEAAVEAVLFSVGEAVELEKLRGALDVPDEELAAAVMRLKARLADEGRGIRLVEIGESVQLCSAPEYFDYIQKTVQLKKQAGLSAAALETLSIIAYNQPVTKGKIEFIRGVDCSHSVTRLMERGFIDEVGRADAPGRPILYATTGEFLRCFGLKNLDRLPPLPEKQTPPPAEPAAQPDIIADAAMEETEGSPDGADTEMK